MADFTNSARGIAPGFGSGLRFNKSDVAISNTASTVDFLMEKKLPGGGVVSVESEYANYDKLGGYDSRYTNSDSWGCSRGGTVLTDTNAPAVMRMC